MLDILKFCFKDDQTSFNTIVVLLILFWGIKSIVKEIKK